jgi:hypothetical protein
MDVTRMWKRSGDPTASLSWSRRTTSTCSLGRLRPSTHQGGGGGGARILEGAALVEPSYGLRLIYTVRWWTCAFS